MSEAELIARIRKLFPRSGDDAAVIGDQVITNDMLVEGVDFTRDTPLRSLARKSLAVNLSDLAAMGSKPRFALVAIAAPEWVDMPLLIDELAAAAAEYDIEIVGGDLSASSQLVLSITAIGEAEQPILRSGARPGDRVFVSRPLGGAGAGLFLLQHGWSAGGEPPGDASYSQREFAAAAIRSHLDPQPEVGLGLKLVGIATACIDVSDGLSTDLHHLCEASGAGAKIERARIPPFHGLTTEGLSLGIDIREVVLNGGEEYALLFTSSMRESELSARTGRPVYAIGRITREKDVLLDDAPFPPRGWDHFAKH